MEAKVVQTLAECLGANEPVAMVTVIANTGSSPGKTGAMMTVRGDNLTCGTVGGGSLEYQATSEAVNCLATGESKEVSYALNPGGDLGMSCGGELRLFIKVFNPQPKLVIVGAGHIGLELYKLGVQQGYRVVILDDRAEMLTGERFPLAECNVAKDLRKTLSEYPLGPGCHVTIASRSHETDRIALEAVVNSDSSYLGMIGSRNKIRKTLQYLLDQGVSREKIETVYAPMGLDIASVHPKEIALSIMSEILLVKNKGSLQHMRTIKDIQF